ncbi:DNA polymerase III subunit gamma/tau [Bordetella flabilis]|uniref:DNA-directed DNA polymerase n=1 Tax=Bordetella flabilis TaxID=463014 RepID=A0A193GHQ8_9BORD|nr:DNA polymerase III subunit gamma/tau [Bordetella flabilis]ANN79128.1 DNA polymerase III, subunit gamma and tau [Bordetella flabilis]
MTYLVLARKWRPRSFDTLVGQDHVVRALTHALDTQRLHHAWLFTGTRGVGKTTLSRILAKSLNCETGITSRPCGVCRACTEIDAGRFVDYLELDAASNRGVDEMTQLLEQAVYSPGAGRFKVYMIDEVHMLTGHAFNAMLKTLEEPPPHVKFILATTDPQKIPVTVLSRCLQFNLKQMPPDAIVGHLRQVLGEEQLAFEAPALRLIAQAASGSMRDALSLTDQAIAYSAGNLTEDAVRGMLGTIDQRHLVRLLDALALGDARAVLAVADELATRGLSYAGALADLAALLSRVAIEQRVAGATPPEDPVAADIARLAQGLHPDAVQLFYSVAVHSRGELALAPDEYAGFVMACLRMLSLSGEAGPQTLPAIPAADVGSKAATAATAAAAGPGATTPAMAHAGTPDVAGAHSPSPAATPGAAVAAGTSAVSTSPGSAAPDGSATTAARPGPASGAAALAVTPPAALSIPADAPAERVGQPASNALYPAATTRPAAPAAQPAARAIQAAAPTAQPGAGEAQKAATAEPAPASIAPWDDVPPTGAPGDTATVTAPPAAHVAAEGQASASVRPAEPVAPPDRGGAGAMDTPTVVPAAASNEPPATAAPAAPAKEAPVAAAPQGVDPDAPPSWVDEVIPDDVEGGYQPLATGDSLDDGFIASPDDDDFETVAPARAAEPAATPVRRAPGTRSASRRGPRLADMSAATWPELAARLPVTGLAAELARQSEWLGSQGDTVSLRVAVKTLADSASRVRLQTVLCEHFGLSLRLDVQVGATGDATAHAVAQQVRAERQRAAEQAAQQDPFVRSLLADFGGQILPGSIRHVDPPAATP